MRANAFALSAISLLIPCGFALALQGALPRFSIESTCREAQAFAGQDKKIAYNGCLRDEADAREQLAQKWMRFRPQDRSDCVSQGAAPLPSYVELLTCLEMSAEAESLNGPAGRRSDKNRALWLNPPIRDNGAPPEPAAPAPESAPPAKPIAAGVNTPGADCEKTGSSRVESSSKADPSQ